MRRPTRLLRPALVAVAALAASVGSVAPARAVATCTFDEGNARVEVTIPGTETATIARSGDEIHVDGTQCGTATVSNTDTIRLIPDLVYPEQVGVAIDLSGGPFTGIDFTGDLLNGVVTVQGTSDADQVVAGANGINLDAGAGSSVDVDADHVTHVTLDGNGGNDDLRGDGGAGTGTRFTRTMTIDGGDGDDVVAGSLGGDDLGGGPGIDTVDYADATSSAFVDLKAGTGSGGSVGYDDLTGFENISGSPYSDILTGSAAANVLKGLAQHDKLKGLGGGDTLVGGTGDDRVDYSSAKGRVVVNLARGTARGEGSDTIRTVEEVAGSSHDDRITGSTKRNELYGAGGSDTIVAGGGDDYVVGDVGNDTLKGGSGNDQLYAGDGSDHMDGGSGYDSCPASTGSDTRRGCEIP